MIYYSNNIHNKNENKKFWASFFWKLPNNIDRRVQGDLQNSCRTKSKDNLLGTLFNMSMISFV